MNREAERKRLVELILKQTCNHNACENSIGCLHCKFVSLCDEEAEDLANALLANGIVVPPCKVGQIVYALWETPSLTFVMYLAEVKEICFRKKNNRLTTVYRLESTSYRGRIREYYDDDFGKRFFTSREEAEAKLGGKEDA